MGPVEIIVIIAAVAFVAFVVGRQVWKRYKAKRDGTSVGCGCGCGGSCSGCSGCKSGAEHSSNTK